MAFETVNAPPSSAEGATIVQPSASYSITMRVRLPQRPGAFAQVAAAIGDTGAILGAIDLVRVERGTKLRDITVSCIDSAHGARIVEAVRALDGIEVESVLDRTFQMHQGGKIEVNASVPVKTRDDLSMAYTPGVARVCTAIHDDPELAWSLTVKGNTVAVVSDGTAVLGLGDIGPEAAMPVMEGKALLFKEFAGVDAFPLCIDTTDVDAIVAFVKAAAPTFGGINLEDIAAPRCFEIERRLRAELDIPVFHDDQHGTAIVTLAALLNALRVVEKRPEDVKVVVCGAGAAGMACTKILLAQGVGARRGVRPRRRPLRRACRASTPPAPSSPRARTPTASAAAADDRARGGRRLPRPLRPGRRLSRGGAHHGTARGRVRDGQPDARGDAGGDPRRRRDRGHRALGLPEPDQQRAGLPGRVPRRARRARERRSTRR